MDPVSIASMGLSAIGSLFSGIAGFNAGNAHAKALEYAAEEARREAGANADANLIQGDEAAAHGAVTAAANGGGFTGSSIGVISQLGRRALYNARASAYRGLTEAQNDEYDAKVARANATNSLIGAGIGAVGGAVGGWAKTAFQKQILGSLSDRLNGAGPAGAYGYDGGDFS